ncbi:hypothetical protein CBER1_08582 [Cercospora berteroae]|uniref:ABM domain-containing protein n=1 Tax=Cercospora berteroae TaxID=357750 RepID=A0A2S6CMK2_9PEZI|nr:hypothetical protein CBER1_08582 [Cercospora berteroae]
MGSSEEVTLVAIVKTQPGKGERFVELSTQAYNTFAPKEPGRLQFQIIRQDEDASVDSEQTWAVIERYASKEHLAQHRSTDSYSRLFEQFMAEELLSGNPTMFKGKAVEMAHFDRPFDSRKK